MADGEESLPVVAVTAAVGAVVMLIVLLCSVLKKDKKETETTAEEEEESTLANKQELSNKSKKQKVSNRPKKESKIAFSHPWLSTSLKGHSAPVLGMDFSPNGKYVASCSDDRVILIWSVKEFTQKEHKSIRVNVELDHSIQIKFSPDSRAFITSLFLSNSVRVFKIGKKPDGSPGNVTAVLDFPKKHDADILNIGISSSGKFIMTCYKDTTMIIWDLKGEVLATIDTHQMNNSFGAVSPCGRFVASSGFTPDVKVWEVCFDKVGGFKEVVRAFELKGHSSGVHSFSFNSDSRRMATVSKDGTWKLWDTDIEYQKNQDPYLLHTGQLGFSSPSLVSLSPDGRTVAVAHGCHLQVYNGITGVLGKKIEDIHHEPIKALGFDTNSKYLATTGDKHIHVFNNVIGYQATVDDLVEKKQKAKNSALKERIQEQIEEAKSALKSLGLES